MSFLDKIFTEQQKKKAINSILIIDFSNLLHSTFYAKIRFDKTLKTNEEKYMFWRYLMLNQIASLKKKFEPDEIILAVDGGSWRKDYFKYYKARRAISREKSDIDYTEFYESGNKFIEEIISIFPYKTIQIKKAEADDIIGVLTETIPSNIKIIIVSRDKDFKQLLKYQNVSIYDPIDKKLKQENDPHYFLIEHILNGDPGDDVPNLLSDDNVFINSDKRQKRITKKIVEKVKEIGIETFAIENNLIKNYERNRKMIELSSEQIPSNIVEEIKFQYNQDNKNRPDYIKITQFLKSNKIKALTADAFM